MFKIISPLEQLIAHIENLREQSRLKMLGEGESNFFSGKNEAFLQCLDALQELRKRDLHV